MICVCIRVLQRTRTNRIVGWMDVSRKSSIIRNWLTQVWRLRSPQSAVGKLETQEVSGAVQRLRARGPMVSAPVQGQRPENRSPRAAQCSSSHRQTGVLPSSSPCLLRPSTDWMRPTLTGRASLYSAHRVKCRQTHSPEAMLHRPWGHPVTQARGHIT